MAKKKKKKKEVEKKAKKVNSEVKKAEKKAEKKIKEAAKDVKKAAKKTADLIPLCHPLPITKVALDLRADPGLPGIVVEATVKTGGQTGVEMEALTAVTTACLTIYDMVKAVDKAMVISGVRLLKKTGGKSGDWAFPGTC